MIYEVRVYIITLFSPGAQIHFSSFLFRFHVHTTFFIYLRTTWILTLFSVYFTSTQTGSRNICSPGRFYRMLFLYFEVCTVYTYHNSKEAYKVV